MKVMKGKYNIARVMIDEIDDTTKEQIQGMLNNPAFQGDPIAIMPDCHAGMGSVIGFTKPLGDYLIPNIIGVDIGCGMLSREIKPNGKPLDLSKLDKVIHDNVPSGFNIRETISDQVPYVLIDRVKDVCDRIGIDATKALRAIGSLGGGNHFIEVGEAENVGTSWLTIHSGSRNFGLRVAQYYQKKAKEGLEKYFIDKDKFKDQEFIVRGDPMFQAYLDDMATAQWFATMNRLIMSRTIFERMGWVCSLSLSSVHNYIDSQQVIRKGACSAHKGERFIIPFNMRDGLIFAEGKGNKEWNSSAPHGAGRIMSRTKARKTIGVDEYRDSMTGVYSTCIGEDTLDEAPQAYKDKDIIIKNIEPTAEIIDYVKPIYNFKSS